jgi:predicted nucleotidyltransferase
MQALNRGFFAMAKTEQELAALLSRDVDLVIRDTVEQSENSIHRDSILSQVEVIHATGCGLYGPVVRGGYDA